MQDNSYVYICCYLGDRQPAAPYVNRLREDGCRIYLYEYSLEDHILPANELELLGKSGKILVFLSSEALRADIIRQVLRYADKRMLDALCVYLEDCTLGGGLEMMQIMVQDLRPEQGNVLDRLSRAMPVCVKEAGSISEDQQKQRGNSSGKKPIWLIPAVLAAGIAGFAVPAILFMRQPEPGSESRSGEVMTDSVEPEMPSDVRSEPDTAEETAVKIEVPEQYLTILDTYLEGFSDLENYKTAPDAVYETHLAGLPANMNRAAGYRNFRELVFSFTDIDGDHNEDLLILGKTDGTHAAPVDLVLSGGQNIRQLGAELKLGNLKEFYPVLCENGRILVRDLKSYTECEVTAYLVEEGDLHYQESVSFGRGTDWSRVYIYKQNGTSSNAAAAADSTDRQLSEEEYYEWLGTYTPLQVKASVLNREHLDLLREGIALPDAEEEIYEQAETDWMTAK